MIVSSQAYLFWLARFSVSLEFSNLYIFNNICFADLETSLEMKSDSLSDADTDILLGFEALKSHGTYSWRANSNAHHIQI